MGPNGHPALLISRFRSPRRGLIGAVASSIRMADEDMTATFIEGFVKRTEDEAYDPVEEAQS